MSKRKAFTLPEILIVVILVSAILGIVYKLFSGALNQLFKSSNKMTNLRAASLILEKLKNDIRCSVVIKKNDEESRRPVIETGDTGRLRFLTTSIENGVINDTPRPVEYWLDNDQLKRKSNDVDKSIGSAKVKSFKIVPYPECNSTEEIINNAKYITVYITVDTEKDATVRSLNSAKNEITLKAKLYPRFLENAKTEEEDYWYKSREEENGANNVDP